MRIISGRWKGRFLVAPASLPVRPTTDVAKEALFNILSNEFDMEGLTVTDLFAGTGNISYEFASRGAESVRAVDRDRGCVKYIGATADLLGFSEVIRVIPCDVFRFLARPQEPCDVVFADPPYDLPPQQYRALVEGVFSCGLLAEEGYPGGGASQGGRSDRYGGLYADAALWDGAFQFLRAWGDVRCFFKFCISF